MHFSRRTGTIQTERRRSNGQTRTDRAHGADKGRRNAAGQSVRAHDERRRAQQALNQAKGRLRSLVGTKAGLRLTPQLEFIFDEVPGEAHEIEDILALAHKRDEELAKSRANAQYAGDADPYKHDEPDDDDFDDDDDVEVEDWDDDDEA